MSYIIPKAETTYSPLLEAYGLARVLYRLSEDRKQPRRPDVRIQDIGWAYSIEPPVGLDIEASLANIGRFGPVRALQRDGNLRLVAEKEEGKDKDKQKSPLPTGMSVTFDELSLMQQLQQKMGYAPITSYERLRAAGFFTKNISNYGYQDNTLKTVMTMAPEDFACRLRELLSAYHQEVWGQELPKYKGEQTKFVKPFYPNLLQGAAGIKARNSGFEKAGVKGPVIRQWLAVLGYFQAAVPINLGDDQVILIPEAQDLRLNQLAEVTDQVVKEVRGLTGNSYSRAVAMTRVYQLLIARGQFITGFLATTFSRINQSSFRPSAYDCYRLPKVFQSLPAEHSVMYKTFNQIIHPLQEVARYQNRLNPNWANSVVEHLSTSYLLWLTSASLVNWLEYVNAVNQSCCRAKTQKRPAPFWTFNPILLKEVLLLTSERIRDNEFLRKAVAGEDPRFNNLATMISNLTTRPIVFDKEKRDAGSTLFIQHEPQYNLVTQLLSCARNREEFRRMLLATVASYNNTTAKKYAALKKRENNEGAPGGYHMVKPGDLAWLYDVSLEEDTDGSLFEEAALLLLAFGTCVSGRSKADTASFDPDNPEDNNMIWR